MSRHTIRAEIEVLFTPAGLTEIEAAYPKLDIEFSYIPGSPATGPSYDSGGDPGSGAEVELIHATLVDGDGLDPTDVEIAGWAKTWLDDDGYDRACLVGEGERGPDPDAAYERMRDDRWDT